MSIKSAPYYWLTCDGTLDDGTVCGERSTEGGDYAAWSDASHAIDDATNSDWAEHDGKHYCEKHSWEFRCDMCGENNDECVCEADRADEAGESK